jgi:hypothetical protein
MTVTSWAAVRTDCGIAASMPYRTNTRTTITHSDQATGPMGGGCGIHVCSAVSVPGDTGRHHLAGPAGKAVTGQQKKAPDGAAGHWPILSFSPLNPRVRGSSPWRRTRDQGSDLAILPRSEPFSCPVWTVGCSRGALEPLDETGPGWTRRTGIARSGDTGGPARAKVDRWNQGLMRRRANSRQSCAARLAAKWYGSDGPWVTSISGAWPSDEGRDRRSWRARRFLGAGWWV